MARTGRPPWAVAATALLLVISTGMAAWVSHRRSTAGAIELRPLESYPKLGMRLRLPAGWDISDPERGANGRLLLASEPGEESGRQLIVFRSTSPRLGGPETARERAVAKAIQAASQYDRIACQPVGPGRLGELNSDLYQVVVSSTESPSEMRSGRASVALRPDGQLTGVILLVNGRMTSRDPKLLDEVSQTIVLEDERTQPTAPRAPGKRQNGPGGSDTDSGKPLASKDWDAAPA